jgi:energy-coupling factor transporter ATP-binding protein EcfA2
MRIHINKIGLLGTDREFSLTSGLNVITGSITTGKTTLIKCLRGLLGSVLQDFSREARDNITNLTGEVFIGNNAYEIVRPFVTTNDALVSIAGENEAKRLPALRGKSDEQTYGTWLLEKLKLPTLRVPTAPTQDDSDTSPLSINDYMMYCHLRQDEIDSSVFGHTNFSKNNKRKYVFEVIYGKYDVEIAQLQIKRRETVSEIRRLQNYTKTIDEFLTGTPFGNRAVIVHNLNNVIRELEIAYSDSETLGQEIRSYANTDELRGNLLEVQQQLDELYQNLQYEQYSLKQKQSLMAQLQTQSARLTKSIVAGRYLLDFDFLSCPRCGSSIQPSRTEPETCYLCLQQPEPQITQDDLIKEQDRLEQQITETLELVDAHRTATIGIEQEITRLDAQRQNLSSEINHRTRRYVSEQAEQIAQVEHYRTQLQEQKQRLEEYLGLYNRQDQAVSTIEQLESRLEELDVAIDLANSRVSNFENYMNFLDKTYQEILREIRVPSFSDPGPSIIDRKTYLPRFEGRRFDELESQGLKVMVNTAHALAHQLTCIHFDLILPNILLIDGLSGNIGYEGLDRERIEAIYGYIIRVSQEHQNRLQIIVSDNTVPESAREYIFAEFNDESKLIPLPVQNSNSN